MTCRPARGVKRARSISRVRIRKQDREGGNWSALRGRPSAQPTLMESNRPGKPCKAGLCRTRQSAFETTLPPYRMPAGVCLALHPQLPPLRRWAAAPHDFGCSVGENRGRDPVWIAQRVWNCAAPKSNGLTLVSLSGSGFEAGRLKGGPRPPGAALSRQGRRFSAQSQGAAPPA